MADFKNLLNLIFPSGCIYCGRLSDDRVHGFCKECYNSLSIYLRKIGYTWYVFEYDKKISQILKKAKYAGKPGAVKKMAGLLGGLLLDKDIEIDLITYVPMHKKDIGKRGYNQSGIAARKISKILGFPCRENALYKTMKTKKQADLSKNSREKNLNGAFLANEHIVKGMRILLIDDIITTGSTLGECKKTLIAAGAAKVETAVIAHTPFNRKR